MTTFPEDEAPAMMSYAGRLVPINSEGMREVIDEATRLRAEVKHQREYMPVGQDGVPITQAQYDTVRAEVAELRQDRERKQQDIACILKAFDDGLFIRNTKGDEESGWAIKFALPLSALARLAAIDSARKA